MKASNLSTVKCLLGEKILCRLWATIPKYKVNRYATDPLPTPPVFLQKLGGRNVCIFTHTHMHTHARIHTHAHTHTHTHTHARARINTHTRIHTQSHKQDYLGKQVLRLWCLSTGLEQGDVLGNLTWEQDWAEGEPPTGPYLGTKYSLSSGGNLSGALQHPLQTHIWVFWLFHCNSLDKHKHVNQDWKVISKWQ